jgi:hypothetical protein
MRSSEMIFRMYSIREPKSEKDRRNAGKLANIVAMYEYAHNITNHRGAS